MDGFSPTHLKPRPPPNVDYVFTHAPCGSVGQQMDFSLLLLLLLILLLHTTNFLKVLKTPWGCGSFALMRSCFSHHCFIFIFQFLDIIFPCENWTWPETIQMFFLPTPLAVVWVNRWTFSSPPSPSRHQIFVSLRYRKCRGAWVFRCDAILFIGRPSRT